MSLLSRKKSSFIGLAIYCAIAAANGPSPLFADEEPHTITVDVTATRLEPQFDESMAARKLEDGDPAALLKWQPGLSLYSAGGISSLPVLHGLNDERVKVSIDGAEINAACANHMNPPLSYVDPSAVEGIEVSHGSPAVSSGGDNLAGVIRVRTDRPKFAEVQGVIRKSAKLSSIYRSNNESITESLAADAATSNLSLGYKGAFSRSSSYFDGHGDKVRSTQYEVRNHALNLALRGDSNEFTIKGALQEIPYQGYVNQYMDMAQNDAKSLSLADRADFEWGKLDARFFLHDVDHEMGFFSHEKEGSMPMLVDGRDIGYSVGGEINLDSQNLLRVGDELHRFELDDRWPAVPGSMMMGPDTYVNINHGHRQVWGNYAEWQFKPAPEWTTVAGVRSSLVLSDTGDVQPYNSGSMGGMGAEMPSEMEMMARAVDMSEADDAAAAAHFNALDRSQVDHNLDLTLSSTYEPTARSSYELGFARKSRSPSLYERYSWGRGTMAMTMIGWFGDANGYVGDPELDPETANTVNLSARWHGVNEQSWELQATPYFSYIQDFIDADRIGSFNPRMSMDDTKYLLQFANHDARMGGIDLSGAVRIFEDGNFGQGRARGILGWVRGKRVDGGDLYHMMPLNGRLALEQSKGSWSNAVEFQLVSRKSKVDARRAELETAGYVITNLYSSYRWENIRLDFGVTNLFDAFYFLPLGGVDYADWSYEGGMGRMHSVPGPGRSFNAGVTIEF
ncbi:MAG: TonB-dependent receptor [Oligoflexia bacterium]|nr:TonB-dependent receptor [Oligoflexia bacterium]